MRYHILRTLLGACLVGAAFASIAAAAPAKQPVDGIELAQAFTAALNAHDVDAVVSYFTEADSGPTVNADRYAWQKYEIRMWAARQAALNFHIDGYDYRVTDHGVEWNADLSRDDFRQLGLESVPVTNSIWIHDGQVADFTATLSDPRDAALLGPLWQPGTLTDLRIDV
jgi:hypothetical protein